ncbi:Asp23/Gls24 family envelope stress response protein [Nocardioides sp. TRM66260-LWL]|uniref:Asp23/Gls24 family envelope stress response protein n=1 Tax=Nocardioides sp. TRM66260-LWL TaxID=2874478 RepID=UPI001CC6627B|nr:Asp23/Gls24 family envelope stress response protein [Nocardioides sp. TRM66260-LWL]MBZ5735711.1 Asp23/Gls24 family envelope stress response protein [Nocardioides sp. TRM66260-LWL]
MSEPTVALERDPASGLVAGGSPADEELEAPERRGDLDVRTRVIARIAERVAAEVPEVLVEDAGLLGRAPLGPLSRSGSPSAEVRIQGHGARVRLDVACRYPAPITRVAADVRERVLVEAARLSGVPLTVVDVTVHPRFAETERSRVR